MAATTMKCPYVSPLRTGPGRPQEPMNDTTVWSLGEHTLAKHELLRRYLDAWFPIMASSNNSGRLVFIDGFAGPGIYSNGEPGSPLIALHALTFHQAFERFGQTEFVFKFIERDSARCQSLRLEIAKFWNARGGKPDNVIVDIVDEDFASAARHIVTRSRGLRAPVFAFIDPFGWSGVPMTVIRDLLSSAMCEVLFNFNFNSVNRFVNDDNPHVARHFAELFSSLEYEHRRASDLDREDRKVFLRNLYLEKLQSVCNFRYVRSFEMIDQDRNRTAYFLMFGTRHIKGLHVMKNAMWALDPIAGARFTGFAGDQRVLFYPEPDFSPLRSAILGAFAGRTVRIEMVEDFVVEHTDYKASHYKRQVLKPAEDAGLISCLSERRMRGTYPAGTVLRFSSQDAD